MTAVLNERPDRVPLATACRALGLNRSTVYARNRAPLDEAERARRRSRKGCPQPRALSEDERQQVRDTLYGETYREQPPAEVHADLLEQGEYLCSVRTMHRILKADAAHGDRRPQRPAQHHAMPHLLAAQPHDVWTWDISKLPCRAQAQYLSLYLVLDLFSRYIVAWMISRKENSALAQQLMEEALRRYGIEDGQVTLHQDRGAPMTARSYLDVMDELGVTCSHSRPRTSNDNPFSESQFKTAKNQPDFPGRFEDIEHARSWFAGYADWYNTQHHHSGLAGFTPEQVFTGEYRELATTRQQALDVQYAAHPERFVRGRPKAAMPPETVAINPVQPEEATEAGVEAVNFPTLPAARSRRKSTLSDS